MMVNDLCVPQRTLHAAECTGVVVRVTSAAGDIGDGEGQERGLWSKGVNARACRSANDANTCVVKR